MSTLGIEAVYQSGPPRLADSIHELIFEKEKNGVKTTPDETSEVIESAFQHLGRLWMAELWHSIESGTITIEDSDDYDDILLEIIGSMQRNSLVTGQWVSMSRKISNIFKQSGQRTFLKGLDNIDWGSPGDDGLISRLMDFRNRFAHGSFEAPEHLIKKGYDDVDALLLDITGLWEQTWHVLTTTGWQTISWKGIGSSNCTFQTTGIQIVLEGTDGYLSLTPFFEFSEETQTIALPMWKSATVLQGLQQEQIASWHERYRREYSGLINRNETIQDRKCTSLPESVFNDIVQPLMKHNNKTTMLIGHPGTGLSSVLPSLLQSYQTEKFDTRWMFWDIMRNDLTQSATCFVRALGEFLQSGIFVNEQGVPKRKFKKLSDQFNLLKPLLAEQSITIAIDGLQYAHQSYRSEEYNMINVCNWLTESNVPLVLIHHPAQNKTPIFFSSQIRWPIIDIIDQQDLTDAVKWLDVPKNDLYQKILNTLKANPKCSLFTICDALDAADPDALPSFEPKIEYALWHLRPLLSTNIQSIKTEEHGHETEQESVRVWSTFNPEVKA